MCIFTFEYLCLYFCRHNPWSGIDSSNDMFIFNFNRCCLIALWKNWTVSFFFFFFVPWGHPLPASSPTTCVIALCLRCGSFMTVKWYLNLTSFPQLSVSSNIYIYLDLKICFWGICLLTSLAEASLVAQW